MQRRVVNCGSTSCLLACGTSTKRPLRRAIATSFLIEALPAQARAQMARDIVLARAIGPYLDRGVVLLAGNGHVRRDIGVPFWLSADAARGVGPRRRVLGGSVTVMASHGNLKTSMLM